MPDGRIDHLWIRVRDPQASRRFYTTIAPHAGLRLSHDEPDRVRLSGPDFSFSLVRDERPLTEHVHLAFTAREDATVRAFHAAALAAGYEDHGAPGERAVYHPGYYGAFVLDPDGHNVEVVNHNAAEAPGGGPSPRTTGGTSSVERSRRAQRRWLEPRAPWPMTTEIAQFMRKLEGRWDDHLEALLTRHDVDGAMADMTAATSLRHIPTTTGADGRPAVEHFYRDVMLPHLPGGLGFTRRSRTVDRFHLVDELTVSFLHDREVAWLIPGIEPTGRHVSVAAIVVVDFDRGAIAAQRTLWDGASLAAQLGVTVGPPQETRRG